MEDWFFQIAKDFDGAEKLVKVRWKKGFVFVAIFQWMLFESIIELAPVVEEPMADGALADWVEAALILALEPDLPVFSSGKNSGVSLLYWDRILSFMMV